MRTITRLLLTFSCLLVINMLVFSQSITWQLHHGQGAGIFVPGPDDPPVVEILNELTGGKQPVHGDPGGFKYANIPTKDDPDWEAAPIDEDGDLCWRLDRSVLTTPFTALDFTYFQTSVFVSDATLPFLLRFYQVDDGARAYVFNSTHPDGEYVVGGDARLYAPIAETDLSPLFVEGEENRIVIVQFDDSQTQNYLKVETITEDDVNNCNIAIENIFVADQACDGSEIGAIEINASCSSCTEDPLYSIDGGQTFQDLSFIRVSAGEYTVVIRDANDETCISDATTIVVGIGEDNIPPSFPGAENVPLQNIPICTLVEELPAVYNQSFVTDNCDPNPMVDIQREVVTINDTISIDDGLSERIIERGRQVNFIYTAIDISNNQSSITIPTWFIPKDESPIVEIANTNIQDILNVCGEYPISAESLGATATDDCTTNLALEIRIRNEAGQTIEAINSAGRYSVTISTTDDSGRTGSTNVIIELSPNPAFYTVNAEDDMFDEVTSPYTFTVAELLANDNASNNVELEIQEINLVDTNAGTLVQNGDGSYTLTRANNGVEQIQLTYVAKSNDASLYLEDTGHYYEFVSFAGGQETVLSEDFNGGLPNDWSAVEVQGDGQASANWTWTNSGPAGSFAIDPLESVTASNGWMLFDSDLNCSFQTQEAWLISPQQTASNLENVFLEFQTLYRSFNDRPTVEVSLDSINWTSFEVFPNIEVNSFGSDLNPQIINVDLSGVVAGEDAFWIAFRFLSDESTNNGGDLTGCAYAWQIDDVKIIGEYADVSNTSWEQAKIAAEARMLNGINGYLATVTSATENEFINSQLEGLGWMGASDAEEEGTWRWMTGPEAGAIFWTEEDEIAGQYSNWASGEPNNFIFENGEDEDYAHFLPGGRWNDLPIAPSTVAGYVVEYGGVNNCAPNFTDEATVTINFTSGEANINNHEVEERSSVEMLQAKVIPNPFRTEAHLMMTLHQEEVILMDIKDVNGRLLQSSSLLGRAGENKFSLQSYISTTGVYFISVRTQAKQQIIKVVATQ